MSKQNTYYVVFWNGYCTLVKAATENCARTRANSAFTKEERDHQGAEVRQVRLATEEDVDWVFGMGGTIPLSEGDSNYERI